MVGFAPPAGNAGIAYQYFLSQGWTPAQAAGIVGNLQQESGPGLDPTIVGDGGNALGVAQWNDRRDDLHAWAQAGGLDPLALQTQLDFISHELGTTESRAADALRRAQTPEEAARAFLGFERPAGFSWADPTGSHGYENRVANALRLYGGGTMPQPMSSVPAGSAGGQDMAWNGGLLGVPAPLRQSWLGGLLDIEPTEDQGWFGGLLNPQNEADRMAWLQAGANLLQASAPSTDPRSGNLGAAIGAAVQGLTQGREAGRRMDERDRRRSAIDALIQGAGGSNPQTAALAAAFPEAYGQAMLEQAFAGPPEPINAGGGLFLDPVTLQPVADYRPPPDAPKPLEINGQLVDPTTGRVIGDYRTPETPKPIEINGQLVDPVTYQPIADFRTPEAPPRPVVTDGGLVLNPTTGAVIADYRPPEPPPDTFKDEASLRDKFIQQSGTFVATRDAYNRLLASASGGTGASDISLVYAYMRLLDPNTGVKEGEVATAENAGGIPDTVMNLYNSVVAGARLPEAVRRDFLAQGTALYQTAEQSQQSLSQEYKRLAEYYGFNPSVIAIDLAAGTRPASVPTPGGTTPAAMPAPGTPPAFNLTGMPDAEADKAYEQMPSGTVFVGPDGNTYVKP